MELYQTANKLSINLQATKTEGREMQKLENTKMNNQPSNVQLIIGPTL